MKVYIRTLTSILRNKFQSFILFLIVFILGNVLFAAIAVKQTSMDVKEELKNRSTSYILLSRTKANANLHVYEKINLVIKDLEKEVDQNLIASLDYNPLITVRTPISLDDNTSYFLNYYSGLSNLRGSAYDYKISEGRFYTQKEIDNGEYKIVLPAFMGYQVGDKYKVNLLDYEINEKTHHYAWERINLVQSDDNVFEFEVIGVYEEKNKKERFSQIDLKDSLEIPIQCIEEMVVKSSELKNNHTMEEKSQYGYFTDFLDDIFLKKEIEMMLVTAKGIDASEKIEDFILNNENYQGFYYKMSSSAQEYRYIQAPLENLVALANVALYASIFLIIIILTLVSNLMIKNRTYEIGVLMAMGERTRNFVIQFAGEILIIGLLATSVALISGNQLGSKISNEFMKIQIDIDSEMDYQELNPNELTQLDLLDAYKVEVSLEYVISIYMVSTIILLVASIVPILNVLKVNPKNVLV